MLAKAEIIGNIGRDPEMRFTPSGAAVTSFSVATTRRYTKDGERKEDTMWWKVTAWGKLAETCNQYLGKGSKVYITGRVSLNEWEDNDGGKRQQIELTANEVIFLDKRKEELFDDKHKEEPFDNEGFPQDELPF